MFRKKKKVVFILSSGLHISCLSFFWLFTMITILKGLVRYIWFPRLHGFPFFAEVNGQAG